MVTPQLIEYFANQIHNVWINWSQAVSGSVSKTRLERWQKLWVPFWDLPAEEKKSDRKIAEELLDFIYPVLRKEIKPEHLKLLQRTYINWDEHEFGAPGIDPKRPYGNSGVFQDMLEILGLTEIRDGGMETGGGIFKFVLFGKEYLLKGADKYNIDLYREDDLKAALLALHKETETALQICLHLQKFETGTFKCEKYSSDWKNVEAKAR